MLKDGTLTYVSLFSSAGVGCFGFQMEGFHCVATNELLEKRLRFQRSNSKCEFDSGYIAGDIADPRVKAAVYREIERWRRTKGNDRVDVVVATPPCQGISVINHKKNDGDIKRNSLVVESIEAILEIRPRFFVIENVMSFEKAICTVPDGGQARIGDYLTDALGSEYIISSRVLNFMNYGSMSSRTRTLIIGVSREYRNSIAPYDLFPTYRKEPTLRDAIGKMRVLEWGEIDENDFYHAFRTYRPAMRSWIHDLKEGESAFDNADPLKRPHRVIDGEIVENVRKTRDKYTRQKWDRFAQCVHTRNDQLAAQNTVHPEQDRVLSIRELMILLSIPSSFRWIDKSLAELNALTDGEKTRLYGEFELNIRQCLGEAVPTEVMRQIAASIKESLAHARVRPGTVKTLIREAGLDDPETLMHFIEENPINLDVASLMRISELCNSKREENAAFYTNKFLVNKIVNRLPSFSKETVRIIEPSVGTGCFVPLLFKRYDDIPHVILDLVDIDPASLRILRLLLERIGVPQNFEVNIHEGDFLSMEFPYRFDLAVGNPPFSKVCTEGARRWLVEANRNKQTKNLSELFLEKCIDSSDYVALVLNKTILSSGEFAITRDILREMRIETIVDFGRQGFTGVSIETICLSVAPRLKPTNTYIYSVKSNTRVIQKQSYITDKGLPSFVIYRDDAFDSVLSRLDLGVFSVFRDRQITKRLTTAEPMDDSLWVLKAKNIVDGGSTVHIPGYDAYIDRRNACSLSTYRFLDDTSVYLTPNMTYNPRVILNPGSVITDGSVAVLIPKRPLRLTGEQLSFFETDEYRHFYQIARNLATQSINVDSSSVYYYGVLHG